MSRIANIQTECGPYLVKEINNLSLKKGRGQENCDSGESSLPLKVYSCQGQGAFPVIIFSHGVGASQDSYRNLGYFWASHGYICIHPTHVDSTAGESGSFQEKNFLKLMGHVLRNSQLWLERAAEISLIIDSLNLLEEQEPQLRGKFNVQHIGIGGHSFGAYTAQLVGGVTIDIPGYSEKKSLLDERVRALLLLSPQGRGQQGLSDTSWDFLKLPTMIVTGTNDKNARGQGPEWRREPFDFSPPGDKYFALIEGAHHFSFTGNLSGEQTISQVQNLSLAFWDAYLKADGSAKSSLTNISSESINLEGILLATK